MTDDEMVPQVDKPTLLTSGTFALYAEPGGGVHLSYRRSDALEGEPDEHLHAPAAMLRFMAAGFGSGRGMFGRLAGMMHFGPRV